MRRTFLLLFLVSLGTVLYSQPRIVVCDLSTQRDTLHLSQSEVLPVDVATNGVFHTTNPDILFYVSRVKAKWFLYAYDLKQHISAVIGTSDFEVSNIAMTPDQKGISVLMKHPTGKTDVVRYPYPLAPPAVIATGVNFTNYAWVDDNSMIVLSPGNPNQLKLISLRPKKETAVVQNAANVLQRFYNTPSVTFIHKQSFDFSTVKRINATDGRIAVVIDIPVEQEIFTWTPGEVIISTDGEHVYSYSSKDADWKPVKSDGSTWKNITSLSVNATGDKLVMTISK